MQKYQNNIAARNGDAVVGIKVLIKLAGTATPATIYSDDGVNVTPNPLTTNANGYFEFYVANGLYDIAVSGVNAYTDVLIADALGIDADALKKAEAAAPSGATLLGTDNGDTVQDALDARPTVENVVQQKASSWSLGGGKNIIANDDVNLVAPGLDSVTVLGGRGYVDDPNEIPGQRYRNSYRNYVGYIRESQIDIGGVLYDNVRLATEINPAANAELSSAVGGGDCFIGSLASASLGALHSDIGPWGSHSWNIGCTYSKNDGFYSTNVGGTDNTNYGNRSLNISSFSCRIGTQGTDAASAVINASLCRHSVNLSSDSSTIDTAYSLNLLSRLCGGIRDFTLNHGFGVSGEIYNGINYGFAFNTRGDNQVTKVLLSRTVATGSATNLLATGDWVFTAEATTQQKANANGTIVLGTNTTLGITANILAMQKGGSGYYRSRLEILARMDGAGTAALIDATEYEKKSNKSTGVPATEWVVDVTVNATTGALSIRFKGLAGETVLASADCSVQRLRALSPATAIVPPIPFQAI